MSNSWGHVANFSVQGPVSINIYKMGEWIERGVGRWISSGETFA